MNTATMAEALQELARKRKVLDSDIAALVQAFEKETTMQIESVRVDHEYYESESGKSALPPLVRIQSKLARI